MFIELVDALRCLADHEETWLVAAVQRFEGRYIVEGALGCPICHVQYPIRRGVAMFADLDSERLPIAAEPIVPDEPQLGRAAALLDLREPGGVIIIGGVWHTLAPSLATAFGVQCLVVNAPDRSSLGDGVSGMLVSDALAVAEGMARGAMLDAHTATPSLLASAARAVKPGGRVVAPALARLPAGVHELARDDSQWVAAVDVAVSRPVELRRR